MCRSGRLQFDVIVEAGHEVCTKEPARRNAMRVIVLVKGDDATEGGTTSPEDMQKMFEEMGKFNEELVNAGIMKSGEGLLPSSQGKRVMFSGNKRTVVDGPFAEAKELVAGF